ncbi:MAG: putative DNA-binding domain-containing protein [Elstera sp.]
MSLAAHQTRFAAYLSGESGSPPPGLSQPERAQIYRNNVRLSLTAALAANFPVTLALVGESYFDQAARQFLRSHLPTRPDMACYGEAFPAFLASAPGMADYPYVPEVARLERAMIEALLAAPAETLTAAAFAAVPPDGFADLRFTAHPSTRLVQSVFAIGDLWQAHQQPAPDLSTIAINAFQTLALCRPHTRVEWRLLTAEDARFLCALLSGASIADAVERLPDDFDLTRALLGHLQAGVFTQLHL